MVEHQITGRTLVWVHLAHPSAHVMTPQTFNAAFRERGIDAVAVSIDVAPEDLSTIMRGLRGWRNLVGAGVTMPHKGPIANEVDEVVGLAKHIRTVNAIRREPDGRLIGANTDGTGFVLGLRKSGRDPAGMKVLLSGVGGAGRALAFALADAGVATLGLANRTRAKAEDLSSELAELYPATKSYATDPNPTGYDLVVNATNLGMHEGDPLPVEVDHLAKGTVVADIIMSPPTTRLMAEAERRGCIVQPGLPMLTSQIDLVFNFLGLP